MLFFLRRVIPLLLLAVHASISQAQQGDVRGVHDPCIAAQNGVCYVFCTGKGIPIRRSTDLIHWTRAGDVFPNGPAPWATKLIPGATGFWAPDIIYINGEYRLYYSVSTFGSWRSCIGLATTRTLDPRGVGYGWVDKGLVIASTPEGSDFNAIDANVVVDASGQPWMAVGSFRTGIKLVRLDRFTGKPPPNEKPIPIASRPGDAIEGAFIIRRGGWYYLFVSFDLCCNGANSNYKVAVGRSQSVIGPYTDAAGRLMLHGGGTILVEGDGGRVIAPGHNAVLQRPEGDLLVYHFLDANARLVPTLRIQKLTWGPDGFPVAGEVIDQPPRQPTPPPAATPALVVPSVIR